MKADVLTTKSTPVSPTSPSACTRRGLSQLAGAAAVSLTAGHGLRMALAADPAAKEKAEAASPTGRDPGFCLDSGHVHCSGLDVAAAIRTAGSHLMTTHLHDNLGGGDPRLPIPKTDLHLALGLGTIPWLATIRALDERGYRGPAVIEGARIGPKDKADEDWQRGVSMCMANWRALEALARE